MGTGPASQLHYPRRKHLVLSWCSRPGSAVCDQRSSDSLHPVEKSRTRLQGQHREMRQNSKHCNPAQEILYLTLARGWYGIPVGVIIWQPHQTLPYLTTTVSKTSSWKPVQINPLKLPPHHGAAEPGHSLQAEVQAKQRVAVLSVEVTEFTESSKLFNTH